jgi:predicted Fe-Mo cluster-binding NifX family protein
MFAPISDCKVLICGGMGTPAYQKAQAAGLEVVLVGGEMRMAVDAYLLGQLHSDPRRVHQH